jgi:hypothetical protein
VRFKAGLLFIILLFSGPLAAQWSGVALALEDADIRWQFDQGKRNVNLSGIGFQFEEATATGLRVGLKFKQSSLRVAADQNSVAQKFDAQSLGLYLRESVELGYNLSLHGQFTFLLNNGNRVGNDVIETIEWTETQLEIGVGFKYSLVRITPYLIYFDFDGDISGASGTSIFNLADPVVRGVKLDYFLEKTAYIRLAIQSGDRSGGYLSFVREY